MTPLLHQKLSPNRRPRSRQSGVVLVVALVMLAIIGLMSAAVMRNALSTDVVSDNNRRQTQANQAAQAALRYCEGLIVSSSTTITVQDAAESIADESWQSFATWQLASTAGGPVSVPNTVIKASKAPQCLAQKRRLGTNEVYVVTARGFSDNYADDSTGRTKAGAVVWLQSIIQLEST